MLAGTEMLLQAAYSADESAKLLQLEAETAGGDGQASADAPLAKKARKKEPKKEKTAGLERLKGVFSCKNSTKFKAQVQIDKKPNYLGLYNTREEAAQAYDNYIIGEQGLRAKTNYMYSDVYMLNVYQKRQAGSTDKESGVAALGASASDASPASPPAARNIDTIYPGDTIALVATVNTGGELTLSNLCDRLVDLSRAEVTSNMSKLHRSVLEVEPVSLYWKRQFFLWKGTVMIDAERRSLVWRGCWLCSFFEPSTDKVLRSKSWFEYTCQLAADKEVETREIPNRSIPNTYFLPVDGEYTGKYVSVDEDSGSSTVFSDRSLVLAFEQVPASSSTAGFYDDDADNKQVDVRQVEVDFPLFRVSGQGIDHEDNHFIVTGTYNSYTQFLEVRRNYCYSHSTRGTFECNGVRYSADSAPVVVDQSMISEDELDSGSDEDSYDAHSPGAPSRVSTVRAAGWSVDQGQGQGQDVFRALPVRSMQSPESSRSQWDV